jgi:hypothetical protein
VKNGLQVIFFAGGVFQDNLNFNLDKSKNKKRQMETIIFSLIISA